MQIRKHIKKIMVVGCIALLGATMVGCADVKLSQEEYNHALDIAEAKGKASVDIKSDNAGVIAKAVASVDITKDNKKAVDDAIAAITKDKVPDAIQKEIIEDAKEAQEKVDAKTEAEGYTLDELKIGAEFSKTLSDREINLFDDEIRFDRDDYDAEEILYLANLKVAANDEDDWNADTFLQIPEGGIRYILEFASNLNTSLIDEDETFEFDFLGEEVEVSEWDDDEITFTKGTEKTFIENMEQTIDGYKILVDVINDDYIHVVVDGVGKKIYEGQTKRVKDIEIKVVSVIVNDEDDRSDMAELEIGEEVEFTVKDGEEYEDDSIWEWAIDSNSIGLVLAEEFTSIDEDEDFKALAVGEKISLPNDYITLTYNGLTIEDTEDYDFELKTKKEVDYVMVKGEFLNGINDYDRIYINESGSIFDDDYELIGTGSIELADTDLTLNTNGTSITIESEDAVLVETNFALDILEADNENIANEDEDYITNYGIVIKNPDDNLEDNELEIVIPEEELTASVTVTSK